jgi:hypothetical protein
VIKSQLDLALFAATAGRAVELEGMSGGEALVGS